MTAGAAQPPIADYALLSDRQTAALVAHGSVDWMCLPRFDSASAFTRLLGDADASRWLIAPVGGTSESRAYRDASFILDTHWRTPTGAAISTDFMPTPSGEHQVHLLRGIECTEGTTEVVVELTVRFDYGRVTPWVRQLPGDDGPVLSMIAGPDALTFHGPELTPDGRAHRGTFTLTAGQRLDWTMTWRPSHKDLPAPLDASGLAARTLADWQAWSDAVHAPCRWAPAVDRSMAVLRALTLHSTGGVVAAPTTSLPEVLGGERNWDYRHCWLRDSAFTISVLAGRGHHHLAGQWRDWLLRAIAGDPDDLQIMYGVDGERRLPEQTLDHLAGYAASEPVRIGNGAVTQYQADVVGEVIVALARLREAGMPEDRFSWSLQRSLLRLLDARFDVPDHGIWEVRGEPRHFTHGRVMMWAAYDAAVRGATEHDLPGPVDAWRDRRDRLRSTILSTGVRDGAFVQHDETDQVDAALLQLPQVGFVAADDPLMLATVERIERELIDANGFVRRYLPGDDDGLRGTEGSFLMCRGRS
ncbi:glycoside hydrolase family 15 protein [Nigerium massiliense]|uniref:glycoside hydrolase family 15 protein n=1 Tax=Nigerium massiliense TaxID=1522317 RepID=UPI000A4B4FB4|nr:glycoside hydrolase family 15 protein [Nigerium massiliense]